MAKTSFYNYGLSIMHKLASAEWIDKLGLRKFTEKTTYSTIKSGFKIAGAISRQFKNNNQNKDATRLQKSPSRQKLFDLSLSDEQTMIRESVLGFATEIIRPAAHDADKEGKTSEELLAQANELGFTYFAIPETLGGAAVDRTPVTSMLIAEDLAYGDLGIAVAILAPIGVANAITEWGTGEQQSKYLPEFLNDEKRLYATIAVNEPVALFNPNTLETTAQKQDDYYVLNGQKTLVPLIDNAELFLVAADIDGQNAIFIIESSQSGLSFELSPAMGLKPARLGNLTLNNVKLPLNARLGGDEFTEQHYQDFLNYARLAWCSLACGTAQAVLDYTINYANEREAFGEPISHRQAVAFMIADIGIELDAMRIMTQRAIARAEHGEKFQREAYLAHIFCAEKAMKIGTDGVQLLGGHGYTKEHPVERWYRDLRAIAIMDGGLHL